MAASYSPYSPLHVFSSVSGSIREMVSLDDQSLR